MQIEPKRMHCQVVQLAHAANTTLPGQLARSADMQLALPKALAAWLVVVGQELVSCSNVCQSATKAQPHKTHDSELNALKIRQQT